MSYPLPNRRAEVPRPADPAKTLTPEGDQPLESDSISSAPDSDTKPPATERMGRRWSAAGARLHARFAETGRKTFR